MSDRYEALRAALEAVRDAGPAGDDGPAMSDFEEAATPEAVGALLAERGFLLASLVEAEHAQCGCVSLSHVLAAVGATGEEPTR